MLPGGRFPRLSRSLIPRHTCANIGFLQNFRTDGVNSLIFSAFFSTVHQCWLPVLNESASVLISAETVLTYTADTQ